MHMGVDIRIRSLTGRGQYFPLSIRYGIRVYSQGMRFGISIPQFVPDGAFDPADLAAFLASAEEYGFESAWTQEQVLGEMPHLGALETMSFAAACTERLRLGCSVFVSTLHNPVHLAKSIATLDQLSRGRLEVGLAAGGKGRPFGPFGITSDGLVSRFTEGVRVMRELWTRPTVSYDGRFWQLDAVPMEPKPYQKPHPPLWFGGGHPAAIARAARWADGFFGGGAATTDQFVEQVGTLRTELAAQGRDEEDFRIAKRVYIAVEDDVERAHQRVTETLDRLYRVGGRADMSPIAAFGTPADCVREIQRVADAGADLILLTPLYDAAAQLDRLGTEVIPAFSS